MWLVCKYISTNMIWMKQIVLLYTQSHSTLQNEIVCFTSVAFMHRNANQPLSYHFLSGHFMLCWAYMYCQTLQHVINQKMRWAEMYIKIQPVICDFDLWIWPNYACMWWLRICSLVKLGLSTLMWEMGRLDLLLDGNGRILWCMYWLQQAVVAMVVSVIKSQ